MQAKSDIAVVGAGAAGLFAAIFAARAGARVVALDGAHKLGAKILVAGGGRCNVTHHAVDESAYAGSSRQAIRKVLRRFDVDQTVDFFRRQGVELKREETGKLFPVTDDGSTILNAILRAAATAGVTIRHPARVTEIVRTDAGFLVRAHGSDGDFELTAARVILATGGRSLPKTGSDGAGYDLARALGHSITQRVFPALVPLVLEKGHPVTAHLTELSGLTLPARVDVRLSSGKPVASFTNSTLLAHFGLSGPSILDASRYYTDAVRTDPDAGLFLSFLPEKTPDWLDQQLADLSRKGAAAGGNSGIARHLTSLIPERLARALCAIAGVDPATPVHALTRDQRRAVVRAVTDLRVPVSGDRGYNYAEVTAGGVPLSELRLETMESRVCPGLHLCGEICDVDGRIGGFNFQWAWASGFVAGESAGRAAAPATDPDRLAPA